MQYRRTAREPSVSLDLKCTQCHGPLTLVPTLDTFIYHCEGGHSFVLADLILAQGKGVRRGLEDAIHLWQDKADIFRHMAREALENGHPGLASSLHREVETIESRVKLVRENLLREGL